MMKALKLVFFFIVILTIKEVQAQNRLVQYSDSLFKDAVNREVIPGLIFSYYSNEGTFSSTYGTKTWGENDPIDSSTLFQLGSIGKVLTAIAVLQQLNSGMLELDKDINDYLPFQLVNRYSKKSVTVHHLLTHTSGLNDRNIGYYVKDESGIVELGKHLEENLPDYFQAPGKEINYSNYSYALAGYLVELVSGTPFNEYIQKNIFDVLEMNDSFIGFDFNYKSDPSYALGHIKVENGFQVGKEFARNALPAGSFISSNRDMGKLLNAFSVRDTILIPENYWHLLFSRQFSNHESLPGYSLGLEEQIINRATFWSKGGMLNGYLSQIVFFPDGSNIFISTNTIDDSFLEVFYKDLFTKFYGIKEFDPSKSVAFDSDEYVGEYRNSRYDRGGVENIISLFRGQFTVWEGQSNSLVVWHNGSLQDYGHVGNDVFENTNNSEEKIIFIKNNSGRVTKLYRNINIGGLSIPSSFEKTKWYNSPTFINEFYGIVVVGIILYGVYSLLYLILVFLIRKWKTEFQKDKLLPTKDYILIIGTVLFVLFHTIGLLPVIKEPMELLFGTPPQVSLMIKVGNILVLICPYLIFRILVLFREKRLIIKKLLFLVFVVLVLFHTWFLYYWNFLQL